MTTILITILLGAIGSIVAAEFLGWCPWLAERLLNRAVSRLAEDHRKRYRDEWSADMDIMSKRGSISLLLWAIGLYLVASRVARALGPATAKQARQHRYPTFDETMRALRLVLSSARISQRATRVDRLLVLPVAESLITVLTLSYWFSARLNPRVCSAILRWANKVDQVITRR